MTADAQWRMDSSRNFDTTVVYLWYEMLEFVKSFVNMRMKLSISSNKMKSFNGLIIFILSLK